MDIGIEAIKCEYCPVKHRWRDAKEETPKKEDHYLVCVESNEGKKITTAKYFEDSYYWSHFVIAWMPLPEMP